MVSDFRKKKILYIFNKFIDTDGSGSIEKKDFELAADLIAKIRRWSPGDAKYKENMSALLKIWDGLQAEVDTDKNGQVTTDEWISTWEAYAKNPSAAQDWHNQYCKYIFSVVDTGNDGSIDSGEYASVSEAYKISKDEAVAAFNKMSKGKSSVSWAEYQELWKEYFLSEDPNSPGNFLFGKTSF